MNREIEKLCQQINQLRISNAALSTALGENSTRSELLTQALREQKDKFGKIEVLLFEQLEIQKKIVETKGNKIEIPQTEFYPKLLAETKKVLSELKEIKSLLTPV